MLGETDQIPPAAPHSGFIAGPISPRISTLNRLPLFLSSTPKAEAMHGSFAAPATAGVISREIAANFMPNFEPGNFSISDQLLEYKKNGLSMREATEKLGLSRNRTIFLCLKNGVDLTGKAPASPAASEGGREFRAGEVSVLRDLIVRQGCSLETAARIMTIMVHDIVSSDEVLNTCLRHKIDASSVRTAALKPKPIPVAAAALTKSNGVEALPFAPAAPVPEHRPLRLRLWEIGDDQCHNIAGRDDEGMTVYCGLPRFSTRQYCKTCHNALLVEPPPIKGITLKKRSAAPATPSQVAIAVPAAAPTKPRNKYREFALALQARAR